MVEHQESHGDQLGLNGSDTRVRSRTRDMPDKKSDAIVHITISLNHIPVAQSSFFG